MRARGVDVGDEPVDDCVVVGQDLDGVAAQDRQVAQFFGEAHGGGSNALLLRMRDIRMNREARVDGTRELGKRQRTLKAPLRYPAAAEHEIKGEPDHRLEQDQQQPALRCIRRSAKRHDDQHDDADRPLGDHEQREPRVGVGQDMSATSASAPSL